jgi:hypothetical protein
MQQAFPAAVDCGVWCRDCAFFEAHWGAGEGKTTFSDCHLPEGGDP